MLEDLFHFGHPRPAFFVPCSLTDLVTRGFAIKCLNSGVIPGALLVNCAHSVFGSEMQTLPGVGGCF